MMIRQLRLAIFVVMMAVMLPVGVSIALSGITVGSIRFLITVEEPITCIPECTPGGGIVLDLNLSPGEEHEEEIQVFNSSEKNLDVMFIPHLSPERDGVEVEIPNEMFLVPGEGSTTQFIIIKADARVEAQQYSLSIQVERGDYGDE